MLFMKGPNLFGYLAMGGLARVGFEFCTFSPVIATGGLGDSDGVGICFLLLVLASGGGDYLQSIPDDGPLLPPDVPIRCS